MRTFRLEVAYDGTAFHGWQVQPGRRTVQGTLEEALAKVLEVNGIRVQGAGRTDAGVHARGQGASFACDTHLPARAFPPRLNRVLPDDVRVVAAGERPAGFHARHSARARSYAYRLLAREDVLFGRFAWRPPRPFALERLAPTAGAIVGEHDFTAFRAQGGAEASPVCRVREARWSTWEAGVRFDVTADRFLYHMVRNLVGTALGAADAGDPGAAMGAILASRDRRRAGVTAAACGLVLERVEYEGDDLS